MVQIREQMLVAQNIFLVPADRGGVALQSGNFCAECGLKIGEKPGLLLLPFLNVLPPHPGVALPIPVIGV
jgi:hypothetical protein